MKYKMNLATAFSLSLLAAHAARAAGDVAALRADLLASPSATQVLARWCADRKLASPPVIRALAEPSPLSPAPADVRALLRVGPADPVRHRRVRLVCGDHALSRADNWYLPGRLTPEMNRQLEHTDTPFGVAVAALAFHRRTILADRPSGGAGVLRVRALLIAGDGAPFSFVEETYLADLVVTPELVR